MVCRTVSMPAGHIGRPLCVAGPHERQSARMLRCLKSAALGMSCHVMRHAVPAIGRNVGVPEPVLKAHRVMCCAVRCLSGEEECASLPQPPAGPVASGPKDGFWLLPGELPVCMGLRAWGVRVCILQCTLDCVQRKCPLLCAVTG